MKQSMLKLVIALVLTPVVQSSAADRAYMDAVKEARKFLRVHAAQAPKGDDLSELKTENPEAYAIVKALLTKRSLGLLDPKHPTASFTKTNQPQQTSDTQGPEVFAKFASPGELRGTPQAAPAAQVDVPYAEVQSAPAHHDWSNWKPHSVDDDETMVANVLGAVAELKGKKAGLLSKQHSSSENQLVADAASLNDDSAPPAAATEKPIIQSAPKALDSTAVVQSTPAAKPENSYLKGIDLSGDMPKVVEAPSDNSKKLSQAQSSSNSYLASFSWDDSKPQVDAKPQEQAEAKQVAAEIKIDPKSNSLMSWLGVVSKTPTAPVQSAPAAPAKPSNPYIMDLS